MPPGDREPIPLAYETPSPAIVSMPWVIVCATLVWVSAAAAAVLGAMSVWHDFSDPTGALGLLLLASGVGTAWMEWLVVFRRSAAAAMVVAFPCVIVLIFGGLLAVFIALEAPLALGISRWHAIFPFAASVLSVAVIGVQDRWTRET